MVYRVRSSVSASAFLDINKGLTTSLIFKVLHLSKFCSLFYSHFRFKIRLKQWLFFTVSLKYWQISFASPLSGGVQNQKYANLIRCICDICIKIIFIQLWRYLFFTVLLVEFRSCTSKFTSNSKFNTSFCFLIFLNVCFKFMNQYLFIILLELACKKEFLWYSRVWLHTSFFSFSSILLKQHVYIS